MERAGFLSALQRACWLLLVALWAGSATAQPAPPAQPKIVVQAMSEAGIDVAAWSPDGRYIWTASGLARELLLWDVASGIILDRLRLPSPPGVAADFMRLTSMAMAPDGRTLRIDGQVLDRQRENGIGARGYNVEIASRRISIVPSTLPAGAETGDWQQAIVTWVDALMALYGHGADMTPEAALRLLPPLPRSPDGRTQMLRGGRGFVLRGRDGVDRPTRIMDHLGSIADAELSPDDRYLAVLTLNDELDSSTTDRVQSVQMLDLVTGQMLPSIVVPSSNDRLAWLDQDRIALFEQDDKDDPLAEVAIGPPQPLSIIKATTGAVLAQSDGRCFMTSLPDGRILGAGLANCRSEVGNDKSLQILENGRWRRFTTQLIPRDAHVRLLAVSPAGDRFAYALRLGNGETRIQIVDIATGASGPSSELDDSALLTQISFSRDGRRLWIAGNGTLAEWTIDAPPDAQGKPAVRDLPGLVLLPQRMASNGRRLLVGGAFEERIQQIDLATATIVRAIDFPGAAAVGYMRTRPAFWSASTTEGIRIWDQRSGAVLVTVRLLPGGRFVAVAPDGRYDTNMGPDSESFRWLISDQPWQSLAPQTLMRDYYEPRLIAKLMDCTRAGNCATALHKVPPVGGLNRQLPDVRITAVTATEPGWAEVRVAATDTTDPVNGRRSGVFGIKLLMNNREVARDPDLISPPPQRTLADWRAVNASLPGDVPGVHDWTFKVQLPSDGRKLEFAAYSFNSDRVKSDTVRLAWTPPPSPPRQRRAFVLTIGVNDYAERRLTLNFAVPDAELIAERLVNIPGYVTRQARLTTAQLPDGRIRQVTSDDIIMALSILAGFKGDGVRDMLRVAGHDVAALDEATPDDIVIISFSGHGYADATGSFALLASDVRWGALDAAPDLGTTISANTLTNMLRYIQAGEIAFIIDACHSGAAVNTPDFKPGPMGDPGLGQLAFDKGIRILAATQGDDVALENPTLAHGLLTAALGEGLTPTGGPADMDRNGKIPLDEWLRYAVARLPSLHEEVRRGGGPVIARGVRLVLRGSNEPPPVQEPSLFDFTNTTSPVLLRGQP